MRTVVHLSDLRFGALDPGLVEPLLENIHRLNPHLVAVAGDLTQRARPAQFIEARRFLSQLPNPQVVVPGGRDVPAFDLYERLFEPDKRFTRFLGREPEPWFADEEIVEAGVNTAHPRRRRQARARLHTVAQRFGSLPRRLTRVIVARHPAGAPRCGADLVLAGHVRMKSPERAAESEDASLVVQAGCARATRDRPATHAFNFLRIEPDAVHIDRYEWDFERGNFVLGRSEAYDHKGERWRARKTAKMMTGSAA